MAIKVISNVSQANLSTLENEIGTLPHTHTHTHHRTRICARYVLTHATLVVILSLGPAAMMSTSQHNNVVGYVGAYMKNNALWVIMEVSPECLVCGV